MYKFLVLFSRFFLVISLINIGIALIYLVTGKLDLEFSIDRLCILISIALLLLCLSVYVFLMYLA